MSADEGSTNPDGGWAMFGLSAGGALVTAFMVSRWLSDRHERERLPWVASIIGLTIAVLPVFVIPVDVFAVTLSRGSDGLSRYDSPEALDEVTATFRLAYYALYSLAAMVLVIFVPFAFFFYTAGDVPGASTRDRTISALKYSAVMVVLFLLLMLLGLAVAKGDATIGGEGNEPWLLELLVHDDATDRSISFATSVISVLGYFVLFTYTAYGMAVLPIRLVRGKQRVEVERGDLLAELALTKDKRRTLESKYTLTGRRMTKKDKRELEALRRKEQILTDREARLDQSQRGCWAGCCALIAPFFTLIGVFLSLVSLFIVISLAITTMDRTFSSRCGIDCAFIVDKPAPNPLDLMLAESSAHFPTDYFLLLLLLLYFFFSTVYGLLRMGVRVCMVTVLRVKGRATLPEALLAVTGLLMLMFFAVATNMTYLAPQYATFGHQMYLPLNGTAVEACHITAATASGNCTVSQLASFVHRGEVRIPPLSIAYLIGNWFFLIVFTGAAILTIARGKSSNIDDSDSDDSDGNPTRV